MTKIQLSENNDPRRKQRDILSEYASPDSDSRSVVPSFASLRATIESQMQASEYSGQWNKTLHFIGIGGSGMSPIARIFLQKGFRVTGSDLKENWNTLTLKEEGAKIYFGHHPSNLREAHVVVVSTAIPQDNVEYQAAKDRLLPLIRRAEALDILMNHYSKKIAIAGTHGKTTTTSMITRVLEANQKTPTYLIGSELMDYGGHSGLGNGEYIVAESDESDGSFLCLHPNIAVVTNIEAEHMEYFKNMENTRVHFRTFMESVLNTRGYVIVNKDDKEILSLAESFPVDQVHYFSIKQESPVMAKGLRETETGIVFKLLVNGCEEGEVDLKVYGQHNVYNALAAIAFGLRENLELDRIKKGLSQFLGTKRRFQLIGQHNTISIFDDYGHHPTEIKTTLEAAKKSFNKRIICIFQPHRYTRTRDLLEWFPHSFSFADKVVITEIYSAHEPKIDGISGKIIVSPLAGGLSSPYFSGSSSPLLSLP